MGKRHAEHTADTVEWGLTPISCGCGAVVMDVARKTISTVSLIGAQPHAGRRG
jgi:hypothetical protein